MMEVFNTNRFDVMEKWQFEFSAKIERTRQGYLVTVKVGNEVIAKELKEKYRDALNVIRDEALMVRDKVKNNSEAGEFLRYLDRIIKTIGGDMDG